MILQKVVIKRNEFGGRNFAYCFYLEALFHYLIQPRRDRKPACGKEPGSEVSRRTEEFHGVMERDSSPAFCVIRKW